jgi:hypothetical protein
VFCHLTPVLWRPLATADEVFVTLTEDRIKANTLQDWETMF